MNTTAIVVARGGSVRLPNKALLPFAGTTLIQHAVRRLHAARKVDLVIVGSDSDDILDAAVTEGATVVKRSKYHCDESRCSANEMIADMAERALGDLIVWAHPTNPLVRPETYDAAVKAYTEAVSAGAADSLCSVTTIRRHCWHLGQPHNFDPWAERHQLAKDLAGYRFQNGAIFIQPRQQMIANRYFYARHPVLFEIGEAEAVDIDTADDMELARTLYESRHSCHGAVALASA